MRCRRKSERRAKEKSMENNQIYNAVRSVPKNAQKEIKGGRLNGKTDINPMWRIKTLTEQFGVCGVGWKYEIADKRIEYAEHTCQEQCEAAAFVDINLYIKVDGEWSAAIPGTGGSSFIAKEKNGFYVSDECFKMALTDALSVACKALGFGADVYWNADATKYYKDPPPRQPKKETIQISDIWKLPGADTAGNTTLFVKALEIAGLTNEEGGKIVKELFGDGVKVNSLNPVDFKHLIATVEKLHESGRTET